MTADASTLAVLFPAGDGDKLSDERASVIAALAQLGIYTGTDLLFAQSIPPHPLIPPSSLAQLVQDVQARLSPLVRCGDELLQAESCKDTECLSTCLPELDELLDGGWRKGEVIEVAGPPGSGKTLLVLHTLLRDLLLHPDHTALVVDSHNLFDADLCLSVVKLLLGDLGASGAIWTMEQDGDPEADLQDVAMGILDRVAVSKVFESGSALDAIKKGVQNAQAGQKVSVVMIDSVVALFGSDQISASASSRGPASFVSFMRVLNALAQSPKNPLTIFTINSSSPTPVVHFPAPISSFEGAQSLKPALGAAFTYLTDITVWLTPAEAVWGAEGKGVRLVELARNKRGVSRGWVAFSSDGLTLCGMP